jgi:hypothetical protein
MVMKQTAVDWLVEKLKENGVSFWQEEIEMIEEAKEIEKEQICKAYTMGVSPMLSIWRYGEDYYNETFKLK